MPVHVPRYHARPAPIFLVICLGLFGPIPVRAAIDDPLEPINRSIFDWNRWFSADVYAPVRDGYLATVPAPVRTGLNNILFNLNDMVGALLAPAAWDTDQASVQGRRAVINTTLGLGGVLDLTGWLGIPRENAGKSTICGGALVPDGPYLVLPIIGSATSLQTATGAAIVVGGFAVLGLVGGLIKEVVEIMILVAVTRPSKEDVRQYRAALASDDPYAAWRGYFAERHRRLCRG